jgi:hypothetical protein
MSTMLPKASIDSKGMEDPENLKVGRLPEMEYK